MAGLFTGEDRVSLPTRPLARNSAFRLTVSAGDAFLGFLLRFEGICWRNSPIAPFINLLIDPILIHARRARRSPGPVLRPRSEPT